MTESAHEAIARAEHLLLAEPAGEAGPDTRWQAVAAVGRLAPQAPAGVWHFVRRWGAHPDADIRTAVASSVLEPLLGAHFATLAGDLEQAVDRDPLFADTLLRCWPLDLGSPDHLRHFDALKRVAATRAAPPNLRPDV